MKEIKTRNESKFIAQSQQCLTLTWQSPRWDVVLVKGTQIFYKNYPFHVIRHRNTWRSSPGEKLCLTFFKKKQLWPGPCLIGGENCESWKKYMLLNNRPLLPRTRESWIQLQHFSQLLASVWINVRESLSKWIAQEKNFPAINSEKLKSLLFPARNSCTCTWIPFLHIRNIHKWLVGIPARQSNISQI